MAENIVNLDKNNTNVFSGVRSHQETFLGIEVDSSEEIFQVRMIEYDGN